VVCVTLGQVQCSIDCDCLKLTAIKGFSLASICMVGGHRARMRGSKSRMYEILQGEVGMVALFGILSNSYTFLHAVLCFMGVLTLVQVPLECQ